MIYNIRFRTEGQLLVLQLLEMTKETTYGNPKQTWRDATVEDLLEVASYMERQFSGRLTKEIKSIMENL